MPITLNITQETPNEIVNAILLFAGQFRAQGAVDNSPPMTPEEVAAAAPPANEPVAQVEPAPVEKKGRRKAPASDAVIDQQPANDGAAMLTIDDARERMRTFNADGHIDESLKGLEKFGAKKLSEVDPEAGGKPSTKYAELIAHIETLIAAKKG